MTAKADAARALSIPERDIASAKANKAGAIRAKVKSGITFDVSKDGEVTVWDANPAVHTQFARGLSWIPPHAKGPLAKKLRSGVDEVEAPSDEDE